MSSLVLAGRELTEARTDRGAASKDRNRASGRTSATSITLAWLIRLRWGAALGQAITVGVASLGLGLGLPVWSLAGTIAVTVVSNIVLAGWQRRAAEIAPGVIGGVMVGDTLLLTALLYLSGGPSNPFSILYLVHVTLAALVLGVRWAGGIVVLSALSYAALFFRNVAIPGLEHAHHGDGRAFSIHLQGMWVAFTIAASLIAYFVARVSTALRERERELAHAQRLAERTEKLLSLTTLAAGAAHELGTPLGTIAVVSKELERAMHGGPGGDLLDDAKLIRTEVERCRTIVQRMSAQAGETAGEVPEETTAEAILVEVRKRLDRAGEDRVDTVAVDVSFTCLAQGLVQSLLNLVQNGLHASESSGGRVTITVEALSSMVRFTVEDRGHGVPSAVLGRLGEPFFTTKPPGKGMGLGLFLAQAFAERCAGRLLLSSEEGTGTRVKLEIPRTSGVTHGQ